MARTDDRPNVIWILGDQHRAQAQGHMGDPNLSTPNLDLLADEGVNFHRALTGFPLCCPSRGAMLTGRYPHHSVAGHEHRLDPGQPTIAAPLNQAGYHTAYFGKWHLDGFPESTGRAAMHIVPPDRRGGFTDWVGYENNNSAWDCWVHGATGAGSFHHRLPGYETDALTDLLLEYIEARPGDGRPFFAVLSVQPPHDPYQAPPQYMARHNPARVTLRPNVPRVAWVDELARRELAGYYAQIENLDANLGRIRDALDQADLAGNTYLFFLSDHGDMHGSHGQFRKMTAYEEAIRIPMLIGGPRTVYGHHRGRVDPPLNHVDVAPTTLGLCGVPVPGWMEGTDYAGYYRGDRWVRDEPESAYLQSVVPTGHPDSVDRPWRGVVTTDGWKFVALPGVPWLMYNLNEDPYEQVNLALNPRFAGQRRRLIEITGSWLNRTGDTFALPAP